MKKIFFTMVIFFTFTTINSIDFIKDNFYYSMIEVNNDDNSTEAYLPETYKELSKIWKIKSACDFSNKKTINLEVELDINAGVLYKAYQTYYNKIDKKKLNSLKELEAKIVLDMKKKFDFCVQTQMCEIFVDFVQKNKDLEKEINEILNLEDLEYKLSFNPCFIFNDESANSSHDKCVNKLYNIPKKNEQIELQELLKFFEHSYDSSSLDFVSELIKNDLEYQEKLSRVLSMISIKITSEINSNFEKKFTNKINIDFNPLINCLFYKNPNKSSKLYIKNVILERHKNIAKEKLYIIIKKKFKEMNVLSNQLEKMRISTNNNKNKENSLNYLSFLKKYNDKLIELFNQILEYKKLNGDIGAKIMEKVLNE